MKKRSNKHLPLFVAIGIVFGTLFGLPVAIIKNDIFLYPAFLIVGISLSVFLFILTKKK